MTLFWKATEEYVVLFVLLYSVVLTFYSVDQTILCDQATEQYLHVMLWFLHLWCLDQNMECEHSLESQLLNSTSYMVLFAL